MMMRAVCDLLSEARYASGSQATASDSYKMGYDRTEREVMSHVRMNNADYIGRSCVAARTTAIALAGFFLLMSGCASLSGNSHKSDANSGQAEMAELHRNAAIETNEPFWPQRLAELHLAAGNVDSATVHCDAALTRRSDYAAAVAMRSEIYWNNGDHAAAVSLLEAARAGDGSLPAALGVCLALHLEALGDFDRSDRIVESLPAGDPDVRALQGYRILRGDEFKNAVEPEQRLVEGNPDVAEHRNNLGIALLYAGRPAEAKAEFEHAHELNPELPGPLYNLAIVERFYFFEDERANDYLESYLRIASDDPDGLVEQFALDTEGASGEDAK